MTEWPLYLILLEVFISSCLASEPLRGSLHLESLELARGGGGYTKYLIDIYVIMPNRFSKLS